MVGNIFQDLFQGQMDLIFFFQGLAFFLVVAVSFLSPRGAPQRLPWAWFRLFALAQGMAAWRRVFAIFAVRLGETLMKRLEIPPDGPSQ